MWTLLLLASTVRSFALMPLGISDRNKMVLWLGCEGRARVSLHTKNVRSVRFVVKRRGCCCNLSGGVELNVWFATNGMCVKNNTIHICGANKQLIEWSWHVNSIVACCHSAKLCAHAARDSTYMYYKICGLVKSHLALTKDKNEMKNLFGRWSKCF